VLNEPLAHAPLALSEQHGPELDQRVRAYVIERPEDALAILDRQRKNRRSQAERLLEQAPRRLVDKTDEFPNVVVGKSEAGEHHRGEVFHAAATASEEGLPSRPDVGPDQRRRSPLLESCIERSATRRREPANRGRVA
jgi:hypothetical protein